MLGPADAGRGQRWVVNPAAVKARVPARLLHGSPVAANDVLRMAVYAGISILLVGHGGIPLYLGRAERFGSPGQRRALEALYETCAVKTCHTPGHLCEIHHLNGGWKAGTPTDIDELALVCKWHNCWFEDHPDQVRETRNERGQIVIDILPPHWASGRGFKTRPHTTHDISGYASPPAYDPQTARDVWLTPTERAESDFTQANDHTAGVNQESDGTTDTRGP